MPTRKSREIIDVFGELKEKQAQRGSLRSKAFISFDVPTLKLDLRKSVAARQTAELVTEIWRDNLLKGKRPSGVSLPAAHPDTIERREYRKQQDRRRGNPDKRFDGRPYKRGREGTKEPGYDRSQVRKNFRKRFQQTRPRTLHRPSKAVVVSNRAGVESGMLAKSAVLVPTKTGFAMFVANARGIRDAKSGQSALDRVTRRIGRLWSPAAMRQPKVQRGLKRVLKEDIILTRKALRRKLARALVDSATGLSSLGRQFTSRVE